MSTAPPPGDPRYGFQLGPRFFKGISIRVAIATVVVFGMATLALIIVLLGWRSASERLVDFGVRTTQDAGTLITERARLTLEPTRNTLRQLTFDPIAIAETLSERLDRAFVLTEELAANSRVSAVYVGYTNGDFILARPLRSPTSRERFGAPDGSVYLIQTVTQLPDGSRAGEFWFMNRDGLLMTHRIQPDYRFDPRTRPWFEAALRDQDVTVSPPYIFFTTQELGLTLSQSTRDGSAVLGIDMVLDSIAESLGELRITPNTELALLDASGKVLAYPDMERVLVRSGDQFGFRDLADIGVPSLLALDALQPRLRETIKFYSGGRQWLGVVIPFEVGLGDGLRLAMASPMDDVLGDAVQRGQRLLMLIGFVILLFLPLGWRAGGSIGRALDRLQAQSLRIGRFDFSPSAAKPSVVSEVNELAQVVDEMGTTIQGFLHLSQRMATERQVELMLPKVLQQMVKATRSEAAAVYLWDRVAQRMHQAATDGQAGSAFPASFDYPQGRQVRGGSRPTQDGHEQMELELRGRSGQLEGLLVLVHAPDEAHHDPAFVEFARQLSGMLAVSIETRQLIEAQKKLLDAVIRLMADAIDAKSPYTGGHCERVPQLATMLADRMSAETEGPYGSFQMSEEERYEFYLGAWLHDCGKVTSPEHIVDKATKLELIYNRIHEIRTRFEVLWRDAEIEHCRRLLAGEDEAASKAIWEARQAQLQADFAFVAECNVGGEFMADEAVARLREIGAQTWWRHFDQRLGLSGEEARRLQEAGVASTEDSLPVREPLLADRPEHLVPWGERKPPVEQGDPRNTYGFDMTLPAHKQNMGELYNLSIRRGTLTEEDRFKINDHIVQTYIMLKGLPWPDALARVPEIAATHHEKMDGKGYPRKLPAEQLTTADRIMALADIFEALTAADRPYKAPKTLSEALRIMAFMCKDQHIDVDVFRYFLHSRLWLEFAQRFMEESQIDAVDVAAIEKLLPAPAPATPETAGS